MKKLLSILFCFLFFSLAYAGTVICPKTITCYPNINACDQYGWLSLSSISKFNIPTDLQLNSITASASLAYEGTAIFTCSYMSHDNLRTFYSMYIKEVPRTVGEKWVTWTDQHGNIVGNKCSNIGQPEECRGEK